MLSDEYMAGLFDGEGCVMVRVWRKPNSPHIRYQPAISLGMTYRPVIEQIHRQYGGSIHLNDHSKRNKKHRAQFNWVASSQVAARVLRAMLPYLIVKKDEAELVLQLQGSLDTWRNKLWNFNGVHQRRDEIMAERQNIADRVAALKRRSFPTVDYGPIKISE